jgi:hypothetical protein
MPSPKPTEVAKMLGDLLGTTVKVTPSDKSLQPGRQNPCVLADFNHPNGELAVMFLADMAFACRAGAALAMLPTDEATRAVEKQLLEETLLENYHEVVNVLTALYRPYERRLILGDVFTDLASLPFAKKMLIRQPKARLDYDAEIEAYGSGKLSLLVADS